MGWRSAAHIAGHSTFTPHAQLVPRKPAVVLPESGHPPFLPPPGPAADVFLCNFLTDSPVKDEWRVLLQVGRTGSLAGKHGCCGAAACRSNGWCPTAMLRAHAAKPPLQCIAFFAVLPASLCST